MGEDALKRSYLARKTPLRGSGRLSRRPKRQDNSADRKAWNVAESGFCECGCARPSWRLHRHHVVLRQIVRKEGGNEWDMANSMLLHETCHSNHHSASRKVRLEMVPESALAFAVDVLGKQGPLTISVGGMRYERLDVSAPVEGREMRAVESSPPPQVLCVREAEASEAEAGAHAGARDDL